MVNGVHAKICADDDDDDDERTTERTGDHQPARERVHFVAPVHKEQLVLPFGPMLLESFATANNTAIVDARRFIEAFVCLRPTGKWTVCISI